MLVCTPTESTEPPSNLSEASISTPVPPFLDLRQPDERLPVVVVLVVVAKAPVLRGGGLAVPGPPGDAAAEQALAQRRVRLQVALQRKLLSVLEVLNLAGKVAVGS